MAVPELSVVVVSYNMRREIPKTLHSLSASYQLGISKSDYEVVLVDNGSEDPWRQEDLSRIDLNLSILNIRDAKSSPAGAINLGIEAARGKLIGVMIDGARMVTPGVLDAARRAARLDDRPIIGTLGFHLGWGHQSRTVCEGYDQRAEDRLLDSIRWPEEGYRLFDVGVFNGACENGWFGPISESNLLFLPRELWAELGGYCVDFESAGGGLVNLDTWKRALELPRTQLIMILGEANFHQVHGGIASNSVTSNWEDWCQEYRRVRKQDYSLRVMDAWYFGTMPKSALAKLAVSAWPLEAGTSPAVLYIELLKRVLLYELSPEVKAAFPDHLAGGEDPADLPIGRNRLDSLHSCLETVVKQKVPGDLMECGVNHNTCILMRGFLAAHGIADRKVWVLDSPEINHHDPDLISSDSPRRSISLDKLKNYVASFGWLDDRIGFVPSSSVESLSEAEAPGLALLCLNGRHYDSIFGALQHFYRLVSDGGFVIVENYGTGPQCARAVAQFRQTNGITAAIQVIDECGVYWRKER